MLQRRRSRVPAASSDTERHHNPRAQLLLMERFGELASKLGYDLSAEQIAKVADVVTKPPPDPMQAMVSSEGTAFFSQRQQSESRRQPAVT